MDAETVNKHLKSWGLNPYGDPVVRVVWSDNQRELRRGTYNEFYGDIFIRTVTGVKEVPKYSWISERWVLERWYSPEKAFDADLVESNSGSYEPVYVFQDKAGNFLPLNLRVVELICSAMFNQPPTKQQVRQEIEDMLTRQDIEMQSYFEDALDMSVIGTQLRLGEATAYGRHKGGQ